MVPLLNAVNDQVMGIGQMVVPGTRRDSLKWATSGRLRLTFGIVTQRVILTWVEGSRKRSITGHPRAQSERPGRGTPKPISKHPSGR
jgi:hypothetical protein